VRLREAQSHQPGQIPRSCQRARLRGNHSLGCEIYATNAKAFSLLVKFIEQWRTC